MLIVSNECRKKHEGWDIWGSKKNGCMLAIYSMTDVESKFNKLSSTVIYAQKDGFHMWPYLMTVQGPRLMDGRATKELEHLKKLSLKIQEAMSKKCCDY